MTTNQRLGDYIREVNVRNKDLKVTNLLGVSISKEFMPSIANTIGTDMSAYKIVERGQFAYGPVTSRNGDKVSIALLDGYDDAIISQAYTVFEVTDHEQLLPEYLMMWFRRPEFDRYARFHSHGSAREVFDWDELCDVHLPIPSITRQREIVAEYETLSNRIRLNEQMIQHLEATAQALYRKIFVDNIDKENLPDGWRMGTLGDVAEVITRGKSPKYVDESPMLVAGQRCVRNHMVDLKIARTYIPKATDIELKYGDILINSTGEGSLGRVGQVFFNVKGVSFDSHVTLVRFSDETDSFYYGAILTMSESDIESLAVGSTGQTELPRDSVNNYNVIIPKSELIKEFHADIKPIKNYATILVLENSKLLELQSLLLAKMGNLKQ